MPHRRKSRRRKSPPPAPKDVLTGRVEVRPEVLFDLIHQVNPTGQGLAKDETARRYEQKASLQSLLIRRFGDQLEVAPGTGQEGIVSLGHCSGTRDACHAVLAELEPDARSWVQHRLDLEAGGAEGELPAAEPATGGDPHRPAADDDADAPADLLRLARRELEEYDYEAAERHLRLAFDKSRGGLEAALPLLELLVDLLGMDSQAVDLESKLAAAAAQHPGVRTLLGLAAARLGDAERAVDLVRGAEVPRTAEVYAVLAARAIRAGEPETAGRHLEDVARHDPTHPQIPVLREELARRQAEILQPAEEALERRRREAGPLAAEAQARELLARWPESEVARAVLREVAAHRREAEIAEHFDLAEKALADERFRDAAHHFQAAQEAGSVRADLPALVEQALRSQRQRQEQARLDAVVARFEEGDEPRALLAWLALPEGLRARVAERVERPDFGWLEEIGPPPSGTRAQEAVATVLAFGRAKLAFAAGTAKAALDEVEPHLAVLGHVAEAGRWRGKVEARLAAERRERAEELLKEASEAHREGRPEEAARLLGGLDSDDLGDAARSRACRLRRRLDRWREVRQLEEEYERHLAADDHLGALERAHRLAERADEAQRPRWQRRGERLRRRIRSAWKVEAVAEALPLAELRDFDPQYLIGEPPELWLDDGGTELVLADARDRWLFIRVVDLRTRAVVERISLRTPEPLGRPLQVVRVDEERVQIIGPDGDFLELARDGWEILRWRSLLELLPVDVRIEHAEPIVGSPYLWLDFKAPPSAPARCYVVDLETWRIARKVGRGFARPILGAAPPCVLRSSFREGARLHTALGKRLDSLRLPPALEVICAAASPERPGHGEAGNGLWLVSVDENLDLEGEEDRVELLELQPAADGSLAIRARLPIEEVFEDGGHTIAILHGQGIGFVQLTNVDRARELLAVAGTPQGLEPLYRVPIPNGTVLAQDRGSRHVVAVHLAEGALAAAALGPEPPPSLGDATKTRVAFRPPTLNPPFFCDHIRGETFVDVSLVREEILVSGEEAVRRRFEATRGDGVEDMVELCLALRSADQAGQTWKRLAQELAAKDPDHPGAALLASEAAVEAGRWDEVARRLGPVDPEGLDDGRGAHFHHLLGVARLRLGEPAAAAAAFEEGLAYEDQFCGLNRNLELARTLSEPPQDLAWGQEQPLVRQLVGAIRFADAALERGDLEAAAAALDRPAIWRATEIQSAARVAEVWLRRPTGGSLTAAERYSKRLACAFFCGARGAEWILRSELDVPGLAWEASRLEDVERRARAWLDEEPGAGRNMS